MVSASVKAGGKMALADAVDDRRLGGTLYGVESYRLTMSNLLSGIRDETVLNGVGAISGGPSSKSRFNSGMDWIVGRQ
jgi:hypothetical protein